jgi:hypothetical protein
MSVGGSGSEIKVSQVRCGPHYPGPYLLASPGDCLVWGGLSQRKRPCRSL